MAEPPLTRVTLLTRIRDGRDAEAWREFVQLYGPVVYRFARNRGLQDADAADLMQDVLRSVARNAHRMEYDPKRGTFRGWLYTVTRNKIYNFLSRQRNRPRGTGDTDAHERLDATPAREDRRRTGRRVGEGVPAPAQRPGDGAGEGRVPARDVAGVLADGRRGQGRGGGRRGAEDDARGGVRRQEPRAARLRDEVQKMMDDEED